MYTIQGKYIRDSRKKTIEKFGESNLSRCGDCNRHDNQSSCESHGGCTWTPNSSGTGGTCS